MPVPIEGILNNWNYSSLFIPKQFLKVAKHKLVFTVVVQVNKFINLSRSDHHYIEVVPVMIQLMILQIIGGFSNISNDSLVVYIPTNLIYQNALSYCISGSIL